MKLFRFFGREVKASPIPPAKVEQGEKRRPNPPFREGADEWEKRSPSGEAARYADALWEIYSKFGRIKKLEKMNGEGSNDEVIRLILEEIENKDIPWLEKLITGLEQPPFEAQNRSSGSELNKIIRSAEENKKLILTNLKQFRSSVKSK